MKMPSTGLQWTYLSLALFGLVGTWYFNIQFMNEHGGVFKVVDFVKGGYANNASTSLSNDIIVVGHAFFAWSFFEAKRLEIRGWWIYVALTFVIALAVMFPLFLMVRDQKVTQAESRSTARAGRLAPTT